ncbi:MAG: cytochrome B [Coriobacteriia bacterium]|nr:cytochrome B [Coriobacteriia bacterium]
MSHAFYREEHPLVFVFTHWINLLSMIFLTLSGFYIHFPIVPGLMGVARGAHFFWMFVVLINLVVRIVLAFIVKDANQQASRVIAGADIKNFLPQKENRHQLWPTVKYYLFLKKEHPIQAKYNPLQKVSYAATVLLTLLAAYTGFSLWGPTMDWSLFHAGTEAVGGLMSMRIIHYFVMWTVLIFAGVHAYLASIFGTPALKIMFAWKETPAEH